MTAAGDDTSEQVSSQVNEMKQQLESENNDDRILDILVSLNSVAITLDTLKSTKIGVLVAMLKKSKNVTVSMMAKELVAKWKEIANTAEEPALVPKTKKDELPIFVYTVKVPHGDGSFHIEDNVAINLVKYRHAINREKKEASVKSQPNEQPDIMKLERKDTCDSNLEPHLQEVDDAADDEPRCPLASPSTLTRSDTTLEHSHSDLHSQQSGSKRKVFYQNDARSKLKWSPPDPRSELKWTPPKSSPGKEQSTLILKPLHSFSTRRERVEEAQNCLKIPLQQHQVPLIVGSSGHFIKKIERETSCLVSIQGKGNKFDKFASNEPLHAKIVGTAYAVEKASEIIHSVIAKVDESNNISKASYDIFASHVADSDQHSALFCKVHFPIWLVRDDSCRAQLYRE